MTRNPAIDELLNTTPQLWQGRQFNHVQLTVPTGHVQLDARLPGKGWPLGAVTELICGTPGLGEFSLLFPLLASLGEEGKWAVLVDPPWIPYPASLQAHGVRLERLLLVRTHNAQESLWACEQALCSGRGGVVLAWAEQIAFSRLRRLQLAAESHAKLAFLFRPEHARRKSSPAALRLQLAAGGHRGTRVDVLKCRGSRPPEPGWLLRPFSHYATSSSQTQQHALAGHPTSAPATGPVYPRPAGPHKPDRTQRYH